MRYEGDMSMTDAIAAFAPSKRGLERDLTLAEADAHSVTQTSTLPGGVAIYHLLTREGYVLKYYQNDGMLEFQGSRKLTPVSWARNPLP